MVRGRKNCEIVNTVSRLLVRSGFRFGGFVSTWYGHWRPVEGRRKKFILVGVGHATVGPRTTVFYRHGETRLKSTELDKVLQVVAEWKLLAFDRSIAEVFRRTPREV